MATHKPILSDLRWSYAIKLLYLRALATLFFLLILLSHISHWRLTNLSLLGVCLAVIALYLFTVHVRNLKVSFFVPFPVLVFFLFSLVAFVSSIWSIDLVFTMTASSLLLCSVLSMLIGLTSEKDLFRLFVNVVIIFSLFLSFVNAYEAFVLNAPRPVGLLDNWNTNAAFLIFAATLLVAKYLNAPGGRTVILGAGISVILFAVALTKSRGALLSALLAFLFFIYLTYKYSYSWRKILGVTYWVILGIVVESFLRGGLVSRVSETVTGNNLTSGRFSLWQTTIDLYLAHPFSGIGYGAVWLVMPELRFTGDATAIRSTHNDYLQVLAELGPSGFILMVLFFISLLVMYSKVIKEQAAHKNVSLDASIWVAVIGVMVHSFFTYHLYQLSMLMLMGIFVGYLSHKYIWECSVSSPRRFGVRSRSRLSIVTVYIFLLVCVVWFSMNLSGALLLVEADASSDNVVKYKKATLATNVTPWNSDAYYQLALLIYKELNATNLSNNDRSMRSNRAFNLLDKAQYLSGQDGDIHALRAELMRLDEQHYTESYISDEYARSVRLEPYVLKNRIRYARYLMSHDNYKPAREIIESGWGHYYQCNFSDIHDYLSLYLDVRNHFGQSVDFLTELISRVESAQNKQYHCAGIFMNKSMLLIP